MVPSWPEQQRSWRQRAVRAIGVFPPDLLDPDRLDDVLIFLAGLPIDPEDRKQLLVEWCQLMGVILDEDMVKRARAE